MKKLVVLLSAVLLSAAVPVMPGCGQKIDGDGMVYQSYIQISQDQAREMMAQDDGHIIVDVRRQDEYDAGHIPGAILIPNEEIDTERPEALPDLEQIILVYCRSGRRSKEAAQKLFDMGYKNIYEFGGIIDWTGETVVVEEGVPTTETVLPEEDAPTSTEVVLHLEDTEHPDAYQRFTVHLADGTELTVYQAVYNDRDLTLTVDAYPEGETVQVEQTVEEKVQEPDAEPSTQSDDTDAGEDALDAEPNAEDLDEDVLDAEPNSEEPGDVAKGEPAPGEDSFNPRYRNLGHPDPDILAQFEKVQLEDFRYTNDQGEENAAEFVYYIYVPEDTVTQPVSDAPDDAGTQPVYDLPEDAGTQPVSILFALNGMGECGTNGSNLSAYRMATCWIEQEWQAEHPCIVVAPQAPVPFLNTRTGQVLPGLMAAYVERLNSLFDELIETYHPDKVYLTGVSMGAMTSYMFLATYPDYPIDASLLCCGFADESDPSAITGRRILIASDCADASVSPANVVATYNDLTASGTNDITLVYSYMNYGHAIWDYVYDNPVFMEWLFEK